jgi:two-component system C4-dicarboxylate transport response regulator DctD
MSASAVQARLAIIEDEPFMAELVHNMLAHLDWQVEVFPLGADLLTCPHLMQFNTLVLDLSLPDIDGFDLMDRLAAMALPGSLLLMSGHSQAALHASLLYGNGIGLQVKGILCKPFSRDELCMALGMTP